MWSKTIWDVFKVIILFLFITAGLQALLSIVITWLFYLFNVPIEKFSFRLFGRSIKNFQLKTSLFYLKVSNIRFGIGRNLSITFKDVNIQLYEKKHMTHDKIPTSTSTSTSTPKSSSFLNGESMQFSIGNRMLKILKWILTFRIYAGNIIVLEPGKTGIKVDLASVAINEFSDKQINAEIFLHAVNHLESGDSIHHIGYHFKADIKRYKDTNSEKFLIVLEEWLSFLRISGIQINMPRILDLDASSKTSDNKGTCNEKSKGSMEELELILRDKVRYFRAPLKTLKVIDLKIENITLIYQDFALITISSAQVLLESVGVYSYGVNLEILPSKKYLHNDHQFSITANSIVVEVGNVSIVRVPLFNAIITTDCISKLLTEVSLSKAKLLNTVNIINPTMVLTLNQVLETFSFINKYKALKAEEFNTQEHYEDSDEENNDQEPECNDTAVNKTSDSQLEKKKTSETLKQKLSMFPNVILEVGVSNFSATLQLSERDNLICKIYNAQCLLYHQNNRMAFISDSTINNTFSRPELAYVERDPFTQTLSNYLKIIGATLTFFSIPEEGLNASSIPICGFERHDTFMDDITDFKYNVNSTVRHFSFTLDSFDVLNKINEALIKLLIVKQEGDKIHIKRSKKRQKETKSITFAFDWSIRIRFKNASLSLLLAGFLPLYLDPVKLNGKNLSDFGRGCILLMDESFLDLNPNSKNFHMLTCSLVRIIEDPGGQQLTDTVIKFRNLRFVINWKNGALITLPSIRLKVDINIVWFIFFVRSIFDHYFSRFIGNNGSEEKLSSKSIGTSKNFELRLGKIIIELTLPQSTNILFFFRDITFAAERQVLTVSSFSALVKSVYVKDFDVHLPLLSVRDFEVDLGSTGKELLDISTSEVHFHAEYHLKIYVILDNMITFFKSIKQIKLAFKNLDDFHKLYPSEMFPRTPPPLRFCTKKLSIEVKEDPFEQELGLIFKIGILEQRERMEKFREFELLKENYSQPSKNNFTKDGCENDWVRKARQRLLENFSTSWINRYRKAKLTFHGISSRIFKSEELGSTYYFFTVNEASKVASLTIENLDLRLGPPSFPLDKFADFIYNYGKKVPKETTYTLLLTSNIDIKTDLWELRARDYPLPAISLPNTSTKGDVVFGEKMPDRYALRTVYVPFVPAADTPEHRRVDSIYGTHIIRTLNAAKFYFNITTNVHSTIPATITWGKSLQPGYESLMSWFDYLTRPNEDSSPKIGFWDKFRFLFHGRWIYKFSDISGIQLNIKGSENPYKIADDGAGLTFFWSGGTILRIHDTTDPREFLKIESKRFRLVVRDFTEANKFDKVYMNLDGEVAWKLGLVFEEGDMQDPGEYPRSVPYRPHYDIVMRNPVHVQDLEQYDAYHGFRSSFIHMSLGVYSSEKGSVNCLYLAPHSVAHFLKWWNLFHTYTSGPIRQGPLFGKLEPNRAKFGRSLFTVKYQLLLEPLIFTHVYRHYSDMEDEDVISFTGLKCRLESLKIDLHQKRVKLLHTNEKLKKSKPIWTFRMSKGEIGCTEADMRILSTTFKQTEIEKEAVPKIAKEIENISLDQDHKSGKNSSESKDSQWFDLEDYVDLDQVALGSTQPLKLEAIPMMYSPRISYFRKLNDSGYVVQYPFGSENSHECMMGENNFEDTQERLVLQRGKEIEKEIESINTKLKKLVNNSDHPQIYHTEYENLKKKLHETKHRLFIIESVLNDLRISADVPNSFHGDEDGEVSNLGCTNSEVNDMEEENSYWSNSELRRERTIETFREMRVESSLKMESSYDNRFFVHNIQFKVNKKVRQHLIEYFTSAFERKSMQFFLTYKSATLLNELLKTAMTNTNSFTSQETPDSDEMVSNSEFMERFEELTREVPNDQFDYLDSYLIRLMSPQLQIMSDIEPNVAALVVSRDIEIGIIDIMQSLDRAGEKMVMDVNTIVETRVCAISRDIQIFTLFKNNVLANKGEGLHRNGYGVQDKAKLWPPWVPIEACFDGSLLDEDIFLRRKSMFFMHTMPNPLFFSDKEIPGLSSNTRFRLGFSGLIITSTSQQYCAVYNIVEDLLNFSTTLEKKVAKLANVMLADEVKYNLEKLDTSVVTNLQRKVKDQYYTREFLKLHNVTALRKSSKVLTLQIQTTLLELFIIMTAIKKNYDNLVKGHRSGKRRLEWRVGADELIWQMFDNGKRPFITTTLGPLAFVRYEALDGTNTNTLAVSRVHIFNRQENPTYLEIVRPFDDNSHYSKSIPMVEIFWRLGSPVGGIGDLQKMIVKLQPVRFRIDHITAEKILTYLFPKNDRNVAPSSPTAISSAPPGLNNNHPKSIKGDPVKHTAIATVLDMHGNLRDQSPSSDLADNISSNSNNNSGHDDDSLELTTSGSGSEASSLAKKASTKIATQFFSQSNENINEMVKRSGTYFNVGSVHIQKSIMSVSYKGGHHLFTDVDNLTVRVPNLHYANKLWSRDEFLAALRRDITKVVLGNLGSIIGNKFIPHKKENKRKVSMDISQLLRWNEKGSGASRDDTKAFSIVSSPSGHASGDSIQEEPIDEEVGLKPFSGSK